VSAPRVSVIVPVYNSVQFVRGCLASLNAQSLSPNDYEVVVVDDGSTDGTAETAREFAARSRGNFVVVAQPRNAGPAAARNAGLRAARADVVAFTDADCEAAADWLERGLARFDAEPEIAAVEGRTDPKGETGTLTHQMRNDSGGLWMTCNMLYRRSALDDVGGFDERFRLAFLEDSDVALGVQERGGVIAWDPNVVVRHLVLHEGRAKFGREARKRFYNPLLYRKHPALYARHISTVVPGLPPLHLKFMALVLLAVAFAASGLWGGAVLAGLGALFYFRRVAHAYRARDPLSMLQAAAHPWIQTYWVLRGAIHFRTFSLDI
jgi:glycosyltransferase involved in cell wall biosynthesis